jgi:Nucleotidyl transferase AbiEii toxin, Type IV TA system
VTEPSLVSLFVRPLNQLRIPYMVTGGVASVIYGEPRFTRDIDVVIRLHPRDAERFARAWAAEDFYVPPVEVIAEESGRPTSGHFNVIHQHTTMRADVYLSGNDPLNAWAFAHAVVRRVEDDEVSLAPIEAVILSKLRYHQMGGSQRHLRDIALMLRVSGDLVDRRELERWTVRLGVVGEWQEAQEVE